MRYLLGVGGMAVVLGCPMCLASIEPGQITAIQEKEKKSEIPVEPPGFRYGVLRAWVAQGGGAEHGSQIRSERMGVGDVLVVEVKNFNGWLIDRVDNLHAVDAQFMKGASGALQAIIRNGRLKLALDARQVANAAQQGKLDEAQIEEFIDGGVLTAEDETKIHELRKEPPAQGLARHPLSGKRPELAAEDVVEEVLKLPSFQGLGSSLQGEAKTTPEKTAVLIQEAPKVFNELMRKKASELKLLINDLVLTGATPTNAEVEVTNRRAGKTANDDYLWYFFSLEENEFNTDVWQQLRKRILLEESIKLTLNCPFDGRPYPLETAIEYVPQGGKIQEGHYEMRLVIISPGKLRTAVLIMIVCLGIFYMGAGRTDLIRDTLGNLRPDGILPYSLARAQMAFWFILVVGSFLFLYISLSKIPKLNDTCLWLIGIGAGTALGAAVITEDRSRTGGGSQAWPRARNEGEKRHEFIARLRAEVVRLRKVRDADKTSLENEIMALEELISTTKQELNQAKDHERPRLVQAMADVEGKIRAKEVKLATAAEGERKAIEDQIDAEKRERSEMVKELAAADEKIEGLRSALSRLKAEATRLSTSLALARIGTSPESLAELERLEAQLAKCGLQSRNAVMRVLDDWMTEDDHYSFHRYQMLIWTLVLGVVFILNVSVTRALPVFDATLLALLGISNGTYLGFRLPAVMKKQCA
ncbi:hypothetical protein [Prosthecobacter sp.]|uniref:hypothetical protein n=1 Tax=Prosthecobacter sp. TaxID=1965333 RepID=UPI00378455E3